MKRFLTLLLVAAFTVSYLPTGWAAAAEEEVQVLKQQVQDLLKRIEKLEADQAKAKDDAAKAKEEVAKLKETQSATAGVSRVDLNNALSKLKMKGRWAAGFFDSGKAGSFPSGSFEAPEAKIQFTFEPDDINKIIMRLNVNNATFNNLDYFHLDSDLKKLLNLGFPLSSRIGRMKVDIGEETWSNNMVESVVPSNSAANVSGYDEGLQLSGKIGKTKPLGYAISATNGNSGTGSDNSNAKAFAGKLYYNICAPLYVSASYYNSGQIKTGNSEIGVGGLVTRPTGAVRWSREVWEVDLRYDFKKGKVLNPPAYSDSKAIVRLSYGGFSDDASGAAERSGQFGFVEGTYNLTKKFYLASRLSFINLDSDTTATLNSVTANTYKRYSVGVGYRLRDNTILKLGYDINKESGPGVESADNNLVSAIIASQF